MSDPEPSNDDFDHDLDDLLGDDFEDTTDDDFDDDDLDETELQTEADVLCPYCGEVISIALDPLGGESQEYTEDCEVCCQPWLVRVHFHAPDNATVTVEPIA